MGLPQIITIIQDYIGNLCIESQDGFGGSPHFPPYESSLEKRIPCQELRSMRGFEPDDRASSSRWHDGQVWCWAAGVWMVRNPALISGKHPNILFWLPSKVVQDFFHPQ